MLQQARPQQGRQRGQHAAPADGRGGLEARLPSIEVPHAGRHVGPPCRAPRGLAGPPQSGGCALRCQELGLRSAAGPGAGLSAPESLSAVALAGRRGGHWLAGSRPSLV